MSSKKQPHKLAELPPGTTAKLPMPGMIPAKGEPWWGWSCKHCGIRIEFQRRNRPEPRETAWFMQCRYCREVNAYLMSKIERHSYAEHPLPEPEPRLPELPKRPFKGDPTKRVLHERAGAKLYTGKRRT